MGKKLSPFRPVDFATVVSYKVLEFIQVDGQL